uniref:Tail fiber protein n=1 Tax=Ochrobactrum phage ORM_20 TaxID=2985243 RepID=A0A9N6WSI8_9VIRU|nr:tail fiber protein [Ochrobactrum phage ORM_20]
MATNKFEKTPEGVTQYLVGHDENGFMKKELTSSFARTDKIIKGDGINITFDPATNVVTVALDPDVATTIENSKVVDTLKALAFKDKVELADIEALGDRNSNTFLSGDGTFRTPSGAGDMVASVYDPDGIAADAFSLGNMKETADAKKFTSVEKDKLGEIEVGATKNQTDAHLLDRQNHTGTQLLETISDAGELAALDNITMSRVTDAGSLATKNSILLSEVTDAGLLAGKDDITMSLVTDAGELAVLDSITTDRIVNAGILSGWRNKLINGDFSIWQRTNGASVAIGSGTTIYGPDRWIFRGTSATGGAMLAARARHGSGTNADYYLRIDRTNVTDTQYIAQRIENLRQFRGKKITISFFMTNSAPETVYMKLDANYGTGGTPSALETIYTGPDITIENGKVTAVVDIPDHSGKTFGTDNNDYLALFIHFRGTSNATLRIWNVSLVEGDATAEEDPFSPRHIQQELALCERYYETGRASFGGYGHSASFNYYTSQNFKVTKRATPSVTVLTDLSTNVSEQIALNPTTKMFSYSYKAVAQGNIYVSANWIADAEL